MTRRWRLGSGVIEVDSETGLKGHLRADFGRHPIGALLIADRLEVLGLRLVSVDVGKGEVVGEWWFNPEMGRLVSCRR